MSNDIDDFLDNADGPTSSGGIPRDRYGRYMLPDSAGNVRPWTRATTLAGGLDKDYALRQWEKRMIAWGLGQRSDLVSLAASASSRDDKATLNPVIEQAFEAAGGSEGANRGTALHNVRAQWDRGVYHNRAHQTLGGVARDTHVSDDEANEFVPEEFRDDIAAYARVLDEQGIDVLPEYVERVVRNESLGIVGTLDGIGKRRSDGRLVVLDLKSEKAPTEFGGLYKSAQMGEYQSADAMWDNDSHTWVPMPATDPLVALIVHVRPGSGVGLIYQVNPALGRAAATLAVELMRFQKMTNLVTPYYDAGAVAQQNPAPDKESVTIATSASPFESETTSPPQDSTAPVLAPSSPFETTEETTPPVTIEDPHASESAESTAESIPLDKGAIIERLTRATQPDKARLQRCLETLDPKANTVGHRKTLAGRIADIVIAEGRTITLTQRPVMILVGDKGSGGAVVESAPQLSGTPGQHAAAETWGEIVTATIARIEVADSVEQLSAIKNDIVTGGYGGEDAWLPAMNDAARKRAAQLSGTPSVAPVDSAIIASASAAIARASDLDMLTKIWEHWKAVTGGDYTADPRTAHLADEAAAQRDKIIAANPMPTTDPFSAFGQ